MRKKRKTPVVSSGSMADIAFLLLIFFMVVTTLQREESLAMRLPPVYDGPLGQVLENKVIDVLINGDNQIMVEDEIIEGEMTPLIKTHIKELLLETRSLYINIRMHPDANYQNYTSVLSSVKSAIHVLKSEAAESLFTKSIANLNQSEKNKIQQMHNIKITEYQIEQL